MINEIFVFSLAIIIIAILRWGFKTLPGEGWQIMASVPVEKDDSGIWRGINLTYYGFFIACAYGMASAVLFILMGSINISAEGTILLTSVILLICIPASKLIAMAVEKKKHTLTIGGASFVGIIVFPAAVWLINENFRERLGFDISLIPAIAAFAISYSIGEGMGKLACISFGCCYGKPISSDTSPMGRIFGRYFFIFHGNTKKIAYESGLNMVKVIPVQAITAVLSCAAGIIGMLLFLKAQYNIAFLLSIISTQGWRILSEFLRADYRGGGKFSAYQVMAAVSFIYSIAIAVFFKETLKPLPDIAGGIMSWNLSESLFLLFLWIIIFLYTGISTVTGSTLSFHVCKESI
jgi:hypothetical protein